MTLSRSDEIDLLTALHEGLHEEPRWATFLARMQRRTRADHVSLIVAQGDTPIHEASQWFAGRDVKAQAQQLADLAGLDPTPYHRLRPGRVYSSMEMIDPDDASHARFQRDYLERIGIRFGRFMRVTAQDGLCAWLTVTRAADDFVAADSALLSSLAPHLSIALRTLAELERTRFRAAIADDALQRAGIAWTALDRDGRKLEGGGARSDAAEAGERLPVPVPARHLAASTLPASLVLSRHTRPLGQAAASVLARQFALTTGEARLAVRLAAGDSLHDAATALGLTIETVRTYSKRLFVKTGTQGQPDLVRLVLSGVAVLA